MAKLSKNIPTIDSVLFSSPEQKVLRYLLSNPTTRISPRVLASKLKGVRGIGGIEGIQVILEQFEAMEWVEFLDNRNEVRLRDDRGELTLLKVTASFCDLESLRELLVEHSTLGILFGSRSQGRNRSDSDYDLFVVSEYPEKIKEISSQHPLGRALEVVIWSDTQYREIESLDPKLSIKLKKGTLLWGKVWY